MTTDIEACRRFRLNHPDYYRTWQKGHQNQHKTNMEAYRLKHPEIIKAQALAFYHTPLGPECEFCGSEENLERHHPDYDYPLIIVTSCNECHNWIRIGVD